MTPHSPLTLHSKIYIAGHTGLAGSAITRMLRSKGFTNLALRTYEELDLSDQQATRKFFEAEKPDMVILAAAKVGGIYANNTYRAEFIYSNLSIQTNVIDSAHKAGVKRLVFLGSSCIYPKLCPQPMKEEHLLTGPLEPTNEPYAIAKIAGIKMCQAYNSQYGTDFISAMPTNLYGPNDNFNPETSHAFPALIRKIHEAKVSNAASITIWGTGNPRREFMHADDMADALTFLMGLENPPELVNIGTGVDVTIREFTQITCAVIGFKGKLEFDTSKPDGPPQKRLDVSRLKKLGWKSKIGLRDGLEMTYKWYLENQDTLRK